MMSASNTAGTTKKKSAVGTKKNKGGSSVFSPSAQTRAPSVHARSTTVYARVLASSWLVCVKGLIPLR